MLQSQSTHHRGYSWTAICVVCVLPNKSKVNTSEGHCIIVQCEGGSFSIIGFSSEVLERGNWWPGKLIVVHTDMSIIIAQLKINYMVGRNVKMCIIEMLHALICKNMY